MRGDFRLFHLAFEDPVALSCGIEEMNDFTAFAGDKSADDTAVFFRQGSEPEVSIDISVRIEDVLGKTTETAGPDSVELRTDEPSLTREAMAGGTVSRKESPASLLIGPGRIGRDPLGDEGIEAGTICGVGTQLRSRGRLGQVGPQPISQIDGGTGHEKTSEPPQRRVFLTIIPKLPDWEIDALHFAESEPGVGGTCVTIDHFEPDD